ncbi:hypothetical protein FN846DRAFT_424622 [Sphaerosporella brunnea]|uniref:Uncharacterized protein n=1 Tax=Sphaerosporella brunnea TaxID=1250544 RepID=A0A5J5EG18_9PEZI|nr:hypothetical protein FN846DRAFT_424622 [Sphaerosporella brunnea]
MWADEEFALLIVSANLISALWSYLCIVASLDRRYEWFLHKELAWYALWYSCQTYAFLVSLTNLAMVVYVLARVRDGIWERCLKPCRTAARALWMLLLAVVVLLVAAGCFVPLKMTLVEIER